MTSPEWSSILDLYQRIVCGGLIQYLQKQAGMRVRRGIYGPAVVLWLMMLQRLNPRGTLGSAVQLLMAGAAEPSASEWQTSVPAADLRSDWGLLPSTPEIAEAIVQTSE